MKTKKIIGVTGGSGYVGSRLVSKLSSRGHGVVSVDSCSPHGRGLVLPAGVEFRQYDLRLPAEAKKALEGIDILVHLAADIGSLTYMHNHQADIITNNSLIDSAVYPAMINNGIKHVIYSSSSMVFQHPPQFPYTEDDVFAINPPQNVYGFSKLAGEYFCRSFFKQYKLPYTIVRYHNIYGPGEDSKGSLPGDIHVIPALLEKVLLKKQYPIELLGDPNATRPFTYIDDAVDATTKIVELALEESELVINQDYNIGNDVYFTIKDLAEKIWNLFGDGRDFAYVEVPTEANTALRREVDITKIKTQLKWEPKVTLEQGLPVVAEWIKTR